jgi:hypothetical protein
VWRPVLLFDQIQSEFIFIFQDLLQKIIIYATLAPELFIDKDVSKTDETLHEECHLKRRK